MNEDDKLTLKKSFVIPIGERYCKSQDRHSNKVDASNKTVTYSKGPHLCS